MKTEKSQRMMQPFSPIAFSYSNIKNNKIALAYSIFMLSQVARMLSPGRESNKSWAIYLVQITPKSTFKVSTSHNPTPLLAHYNLQTK